MNTVNSLALFPQSPETILTNQEMKLKALKFTIFFVDEIIKSIRLFFFDKKLREFDAHVGETLCQIRAYKMLLLANSYKSQEYLEGNKQLQKFKIVAEKVKKRISEFVEAMDNKKGKYNKFLDKAETLQGFFERNELVFDLPDFIFYLVQSKILTTYSIKDKFDISLEIDNEKLSSDLGCGKTVAKKIIRYFQKNLSEYSCQFIEKLLKDLGSLSLSELQKILPYLQIVDNHKRCVLPCYEVTLILMSHINQSAHPIFVIVHRLNKQEECVDIVNLFFKFRQNKFVLCKNINITDLKNPCIVVEGITRSLNKSDEEIDEFVMRFNEVSLMQIILANMAHHPQFSAKELEVLAKNPYAFLLNSGRNILSDHLKFVYIDQKLIAQKELRNIFDNRQEELLAMQNFAEMHGCCQNNSSLFFVRHIYCDILENRLNKYKNIGAKIRMSYYETQF